jgi:hypothetical protein
MFQERQSASMLNLFRLALCGDHLLLRDLNAFRFSKHHRLQQPKLANRHLLLRVVKQLYQMELSQKKDDLVDIQLLVSDRFVMEV